ncbi:hypothetical protein [Thermithiobacillus plumbiphilus]|uniref:Uncharacterized protein n=1 Tax=Thermithiobacillus plumbiphilus TaxID=1729899 RepID=A0ABU9D554_9PROT
MIAFAKGSMPAPRPVVASNSLFRGSPPFHWLPSYHEQFEKYGFYPAFSNYFVKGPQKD